MTENKTDEANYNIMIDISKTDFKKAIKVHKRFSLTGKGADQTSLGCIQFKITEKKLILSSTNGSTALTSELELLDKHTDTTGTFYLSTELLNKLAFPKGKMDVLRISADSVNAEFIDFEFSLSQMISIKRISNFPNLKEIEPKDNFFIVKLSLSQIKDIAQMYSKTSILNFAFDAKNNLKNIVVSSEETEFFQTALLAPWKEKQE